MDALLKKCTYCGKEIIPGERASVCITNEKLSSAFFHIDCFNKTQKLVSRIMKKMGKKKFLKLINEAKE